MIAWLFQVHFFHFKCWEKKAAVAHRPPWDRDFSLHIPLLHGHFCALTANTAPLCAHFWTVTMCPLRKGSFPKDELFYVLKWWQLWISLWQQHSWCLCGSSKTSIYSYCSLKSKFSHFFLPAQSFFRSSIATFQKTNEVYLLRSGVLLSSRIAMYLGLTWCPDFLFWGCFPVSNSSSSLIWPESYGIFQAWI